ncbi:MAG: alpha/beta hydrolase [Alphaproteobacteria bacterium]
MMTTEPADEHFLEPLYLEREGKPMLAYRYSPATAEGAGLPLVMFCGGYRSDMNGTKAQYLEARCNARGQAYLRFDYSGHGASNGKFEDGTIGAWAGDAVDIFDHVAEGPSVIVGSSMGGWIALLLARARAGHVRGVVGIAAAPDFSEDIFASLSPAQQEKMMDTGHVRVPNDYSDEPYHYSRDFYLEAKEHLLLTEKQSVDFPIRLIQGCQDKDVPWEMAVKIQKNYTGADVDVVFVDDGDHRLSRPEDLELINREVLALSEAIAVSF